MSEPGPLVDEAARLLSAVEAWARQRSDGLRAGAGVLWDDEHLANGSAACALCPVCQAVAALRKVNPQTVDHLLDATASMLAALRSTVNEHRSPDPAATQPVERIVVREGEC